MRGVRGRVLSPWAHNAGAANKGAGPTTQDIRGKNFLPGRHPGVRRVARGQTLQDDPLPDPAGRVGKVFISLENFFPGETSNKTSKLKILLPKAFF
jgi:hypothetical protein